MNKTLQNIIYAVDNNEHYIQLSSNVPVGFKFHITYPNEVSTIEINGTLKSIISSDIDGIISFEVISENIRYFIDYQYEHITRPYITISSTDEKNPLNDAIDETHLPLAFLRYVLKTIKQN